MDLAEKLFLHSQVSVKEFSELILEMTLPLQPNFVIIITVVFFIRPVFFNILKFFFSVNKFFILNVILRIAHLHSGEGGSGSAHPNVWGAGLQILASVEFKCYLS